MAQFHETSIKVQAHTPNEVAERVKILETLNNHITLENLRLLSEKSKKAGINEKIKKYKAII